MLCGLIRAAAHSSVCALAAATVVVTSAAVPSSAVPLPARASQNIVAIADIHGDFDAFLTLLQHVQIIDEGRRWIAGPVTLVQTGDYLDRGPKVRELMDFLMSLEQVAAAGGGKAIVLMGNHEAMNAIGDLRDVSAAAFASFADSQSGARREAAFAARAKLAEGRRAALAAADATIEVPKSYLAPDRDQWLAAHPMGFVEYMDAFGPEGAYGKWLRTRMVTVRVADTVFLHGGVNPEVAPKKLESWNEQAQKELAKWDRMRKWMIDQHLALPSFTFDELLDCARAELLRAAAEARNRAALTGQPPPAAASQAIQQHPLFDMQSIGKWSIVDPNGPLWFRGFATWRSEDGAPQINELQRRYGQVRFVVGHTMPAGFRVVARFSSRVFLLDTGMLSSYYQGGRASALEIHNGVFTVVTMDDRRVLFDPMADVTK
jgi:hypothetical protein